jgi:hypothetical protein
MIYISVIVNNCFIEVIENNSFGYFFLKPIRFDKISAVIIVPLCELLHVVEIKIKIGKNMLRSNLIIMIVENFIIMNANVYIAALQ